MRKIVKKVLSIVLSSVIVLYPQSITAISKETVNLDIQSDTEDKIDSKVRECMQNGDDIIPVAIWYKDIDHGFVEETTASRIGYSMEEIEMDYPLPSKELIETLSDQAIKSDSTMGFCEMANVELSDLMRSHLDLTSQMRKIEQERVDEYIRVKNEILQSEYNNAAARLITSHSIDENDLIFTSGFTPLIVGSLSSEEVDTLSRSEEIDEILYFEQFECENCSVLTQNDQNTIRSSMGFANIPSSLAYDGSGVKVGIYETDTVDLDLLSTHHIPYSDVTIETTVSHPGDHATYVASVAAGDYGVAPGALIYSASLDKDWIHLYSNQNLANLEWLISNGVRIINISWGIIRNSSTTSFYHLFEKYIDELIKNCNVTIVVAAGNNDTDYIHGPALSYNCISVNGFTNNRIKKFCYNHGNGCFKPDVIAESLVDGGTSTAAPVISGMITILFDYKPSLSLYPHAVKAIVMASSHQKLSQLEDNTNLNETLEAGLTTRQGSGIPNIFRMISMAAQHSYGMGILNSTNSYDEDCSIIQPKYNNQKMNVCMAFLQSGVSVTNPIGTIADVDLSVNNSISNLVNSSTEMVYLTMSNNTTYNLKVARYGANGSSIPYAYAWSTNNMRFSTYNENEGVYYIRNRSDNTKYLNISTNSSSPSYGSFNSEDSKWVVKYSLTDCRYIVQSANNHDYGLTKGTTYSYGYNVVASSTAITPDILIYNNSDGSNSFVKKINNSYYALGVYSSSLKWRPISNNPSTTNIDTFYLDLSDNSTHWDLIKNAYLRGDANMDGAINASDATITLQIAAQMGTSGVSSYSNASVFLADYNGNGVTNSVDANLIYQNYT